MKQDESLHILVVGPAHTSQAQQWIRGLLDEQEVRITLLTEKPLEGTHLPVRTRLLPGKRLPRVVRHILGSIYLPFLAWTERVDVVHFQSIGINAILAILAPPRKLLLFPWGSDVALLKKHTPRFYLVRWVVRRARRILTTSEEMKSKLVTLFGVESQKIHVVSAGVDAEVFRPVRDTGESRKERTQWGLPPDEIVILSNRTIASIYRTHELVKAFASIDGSSMPSHLVLVRGFTPANHQAREKQELYIRELQELIAPIKHRVTLLERPIGREEMASLLRASDIVVAIPKTDQRSSSALEAIASGKRVILSDIPANREIAAQGAKVSLVGEPVEQSLSRLLSSLGPLDEASLRMNLDFIDRFELRRDQFKQVVQIHADIARDG